MDVSVVIVEQLDLNGYLRSFRMKAEYGQHVTIALAGEYDEPRNGPFHFLDPVHQKEFDSGFGECSARRLTESRFRYVEPYYHFNTSWSGIPTEQGRLSYYALSLPEYCTPNKVKFFDPRTGREFIKSVSRDDQRNRFVLYLECRSSHGSFDFRLELDFEYSRDHFKSFDFHDRTTTGYEAHHESYDYLLRDDEKIVVQQFFMDRINMGDYYVTGQAGAVGPNAISKNNNIQQVRDQNYSDIDLTGLTEELARLRKAIKLEGNTIDHDKALASVAAAEEAAAKKDGAETMRHLRAAGKWTLDIATKIGTTVASKAITNALGL